LVFTFPCEQHLVWVSSKKNNLCPIRCKFDQFNRNLMSIQRCILCILRGILRYIKINECISMTTLHVYLSIIISINGLDVMITLCVCFEYIKILCKIFINILWPYCKCTQVILLYFLKLLQINFIIIIIINFVIIKSIHLKYYLWPIFK